MQKCAIEQMYIIYGYIRRYNLKGNVNRLKINVGQVLTGEIT